MVQVNHCFALGWKVRLPGASGFTIVGSGVAPRHRAPQQGRMRDGAEAELALLQEWRPVEISRF